MSETSISVGENIRKIRKAKNITLINMAQAINKGKSTVSKYETGEIAIDIDTLCEIANFLDVPVSVLIAKENTHEKSLPLSSSFKTRYIYFYDGRVKKIICGVIEEYSSEGSGDNILMYFDVKDEKDYKACSTFYKGTAARCEFVDNYSLLNQNNSAERVWFCCLNNLRSADVRLGVLSGLSYKTMLPVSIKALVSDHPIPKDEKLEEALLLSKEDIKLTKKHNMFTLCERI